MIWSVRKLALRSSKFFLASVCLVSFCLFVLFAFILYNNSLVMLSPPAANEGLGGFFVEAFVIGMLITLAVVIVILYLFLHHFEEDR